MEATRLQLYSDMLCRLLGFAAALMSMAAPRQSQVSVEPPAPWGVSWSIAKTGTSSATTACTPVLPVAPN